MLESACKALGVPNLVEIVASAPISRLQPILIHAFTRRANARSPADLLQQYEQHGAFLGTSSIPQQDLLRQVHAGLLWLPNHR